MQSLDDVDFTVLAATSVLGDLIDKCPPAEACRDAFDRMSKATIQMCMSTTGFGPQALRALPQQPTSTAPKSDAVEADMQGFVQPSHFPQPPRRPVPRFDMNLKDLFSDDETDKRSFSRVSNKVNTMRPPPPPPPQQIKSEPPSFPGDPKISPNLHTQPFAFPPHSPFPTTSTHTPPPPPSPRPPPPTPPPPQKNKNKTNQPYTPRAALNSAVPASASAYPDLGFDDLGFLDSFPVPSASGDAATQDVGIGFGMGFGDGTHDWSDGNGLDLFDGFFFGPGGTGM